MISGVLSKTGYVPTLIMSQLYYSDRNDFGVFPGYQGFDSVIGVKSV